MHKAFTVHMLNDQGKTKAISIASAFDALLTELEKYCPIGRELALVITKLEEAAFFAKKAMANDPNNGVEAPGTAQSVPTPPAPGPITADGKHELLAPLPPAAPEAPPAVTRAEGDPFDVHR